MNIVFVTVKIGSLKTLNVFFKKKEMSLFKVIKKPREKILKINIQ